MDLSYTTRATCRACGEGDLTFLFSLGEQYVSNFVKREHIHSGPKAPLELVLCCKCSLVQLKHTAPQEFLYKRHYWYRSARNATMVKALRDITTDIESRVELNPGDVVLDIGSNDGTLLRAYTKPGIRRIGIEPANNLATLDNYAGLELVHDFWPVTPHKARESNAFVAKPFMAKVITAIGMLYDLEDPNAFIAAMARTLAPGGLLVAQLMCLKNMVALADVGNFCHEHLEYYSLESLVRLLAKHGLEIIDLQTNLVNGESYRLYVGHRPCDQPTLAQPAFTSALAEEKRLELDNQDTYKRLYSRMTYNKNQCVSFINQEVSKGKSVWVYGASTKGNTILQYYGLDNKLITGAADRSPEKWDLYTIGTGIPIHSEYAARQQKPDYFLVLPYAFLDEFMEREKKWRAGGGRFIVPLPDFRVV